MAFNPQDPVVNQILNQLNLIQQYLGGMAAQINSMAQSIDNMNKSFAENMTALSENMRLILEVIKKSRQNLAETVDDIKKEMTDNIKTLYEKKTLESITKQELKAIAKLKELNAIVSDTLYMQQLLSIIQSIREIIGRALSIKLKKEQTESGNV